MSKIIINIASNHNDVYYENDNNTCTYHIATFKDGIVTINELTNRTVIKLTIELLFKLGKALYSTYKSI